MNKFIYFTLFLLFPLLAFAQPDSSSVVLRFSGGYADTGSSNGVASLGATSSNTRDWNVRLTVGLPVGKCWEVGLGFEYLKQKTTAESKIYLQKQWLAIERTETVMNLFIGKVYMAGHWRILNRLYFNPMLYLGIGKAKGTQKSDKAVREMVYIEPGTIIDIGPPSQINGLWFSEMKISYDYFAIGLAPAFSYYLTKHFALNLETGNFRFSTADWDWDNKQWLANVNPMYWQLGIIVTF